MGLVLSSCTQPGDAHTSWRHGSHRRCHHHHHCRRHGRLPPAAALCRRAEGQVRLPSIETTPTCASAIAHNAMEITSSPTLSPHQRLAPFSLGLHLISTMRAFAQLAVVQPCLASCPCERMRRLCNPPVPHPSGITGARPRSDIYHGRPVSRNASSYTRMHRETDGDQKKEERTTSGAGVIWAWSSCRLWQGSVEGGEGRDSAATTTTTVMAMVPITIVMIIAASTDRERQL